GPGRVGGVAPARVLAGHTAPATPWFATGYVAGPSLRQVVAHEFGPLPGRSVRILAAGLAYALQDIHGAGIVHRDLKPSNVLITLDGPRVIDFGIARAPAGSAAGPDRPDPGLTRVGEVIGSPGFMAPEQIRGEPVTAACDIFCLGAVLVYAATGRLPFGDAEQPGGLAGLLLRSTGAEPDLTGVPAELHDLVRDCLRADPAARPGPAEVLARVGAGDTVADGRALEPWLPAPLVAGLGRHAVRLLDREDAGPDRAAAPPPPAPAVPAYSAAVPAPSYPAYPGYPGYPAHPGCPPGVSQPQPQPLPPRPRTASTALLLVVATLVAVLSAGTVYAVMSGAEDPRPPVGTGRTPSASASSAASASASASASPSASASAAPYGALPEAYLGTWEAVQDGRTWTLTLSRGAVGDPVMSLAVEGSGFACAWSAPLRSASEPVELDASTVTSGAPPTCTPGAWSRLRLLPDGTLSRELAGSDNPPLTYRRQ
ncbi:protein kinase, partial [Streptomyces sp. NPDC059558]|uniref:protein kinase domain-containing protein n=1 Tax=Streptomyces sp. NPDC059558 TaxID=3346864 RepID=UPI0036CE672F